MDLGHHLAHHAKEIMYYSMIKTVIIWTLFGAIISLLQTWGVIYLFRSSELSPFRLKHSPYFSSNGLEITTTPWMSVTDGDRQLFVRARVQSGGYVFEVTSTEIPQDVNESFPVISIPNWSFTASNSHNQSVFGNEAGVFTKEQAGGWPFVAWKGEYYYDIDQMISASNWCFSDNDADALHVYFDGVIFPFRPLFPGVMFNAAIFGMCVYVTQMAVRVASRQIKTKLREYKKLCPTCAYDIQNLPTCPECGEHIGTKHKVDA